MRLQDTAAIPSRKRPNTSKRAVCLEHQTFYGTHGVITLVRYRAMAQRNRSQKCTSSVAKQPPICPAGGFCDHRKLCDERRLCTRLSFAPMDAIDVTPAVHFVGFRGQEYQS